MYLVADQMLTQAYMLTQADMPNKGQPTTPDSQTGTANVVCDSLRVDGASPAIVVGDQEHYRTLFIHAARNSLT